MVDLNVQDLQNRQKAAMIKIVQVSSKMAIQSRFASIDELFKKHKKKKSQIIHHQGRHSRGFQGGTCTAAFLPSPGIFEVHNFLFFFDRENWYSYSPQCTSATQTSLAPLQIVVGIATYIGSIAFFATFKKVPNTYVYYITHIQFSFPL